MNGCTTAVFVIGFVPSVSLPSIVVKRQLTEQSEVEFAASSGPHASQQLGFFWRSAAVTRLSAHVALIIRLPLAGLLARRRHQQFAPVLSSGWHSETD